jgi:hypothetical protein
VQFYSNLTVHYNDKLTNNFFYLKASRIWISSILPHDQLNLSRHVFVVNGLALFVIDSPTGLARLLEITRPSVLIEKSFTAHYPVKEPHRFVHVLIPDQHRPRDEPSMVESHFCLDRWIVIVRNSRTQDLAEELPKTKTQFMSNSNDDDL